MRITGNFIIDCALLAWFLAQLIKVVLEILLNNTLDLRKLVSSGGMPSSHSSLVMACTVAVARTSGTDSPLFGVCVVFSAVVMYDAFNVRRSAGDTAKLVNLLLAHVEKLAKENFADDLKIIMGHTPLQVLIGALLGVAVGLLM